MDARTELKQVQEEWNKHYVPLSKRERELRDIIEQEDIEKQKEIFKAIEGKLYYGDKTTWSGYQNTIYLVKATTCEDWTQYNSCNIIQLRIELIKGKLSSLHLAENTSRVDCFKTHYKPLTAELFNEVKEFLNTEILKSLNHFVCDGEK